jgi:hypothetical protein
MPVSSLFYIGLRNGMVISGLLWLGLFLASRAFFAF